MSKNTTKNPAKNLVAGGCAGAIEIMTMYPTEFVKTQLQLDARTAKPVFKGPWDVLQQTVRTKGVLGL